MYPVEMETSVNMEIKQQLRNCTGSAIGYCKPTSRPSTEHGVASNETTTTNSITDCEETELPSELTRLNTGSKVSLKNDTMIHSSQLSCKISTRLKMLSSLFKPFKFLRRRYGLVLASLSPLFFSIQNLFVDVLTETLDSFQVVFMHVPLLMIFCLVIIIYKGVRPSRNYKHYLWLLGSGTCQAANACLFALALTYLAVGDAVTIMFTALIQVCFFSWLILKEPVRMLDIVFAFLAFAGVILIARPPFIFRIEAKTSAYDVPLLGVLYALAASCTVAMFFVFNRKLSKLGLDSFFCIFLNTSTVVLSSGFMSVILNRWKCPTMQEWLYALLAGVVYIFAHVTLFCALKSETATLVTIIGTMEIVMAYVWQLLFLRLLPFWTSYVGAVLIFTACIGISFKNKQLTTPSAPDPSEVMDVEL